MSEEMTESQLEGLAELRKAYSQAERDEAAKKGEAMADGSYPVKNEADLKNAIRAVGRGNASHDSIRKFIIGRAKALGLSKLIPDGWGSDGSKEEKSAEEIEQRADDTCPECEGSGELDNGDTCPQCEGSGKLNPERSADPEFEWRKRKVEEMGLGRVSEKRAYKSEIEIRESSSDAWTLTGYASVTEEPYEVGFYTERIARGAFKRTLKSEPDVVLNINHGDGASGLPIARTKAGTLTLEEDRHGLFVEANLDPLDPDVQLLHRKMQRGDLDGQMSFAFIPDDQTWSEDLSERTLNAVTINRGDVSIVTQGANPQTSSQFRGWEAASEEERATALMELRSGDPSEHSRTLLSSILGEEERSGRVISSANVQGLKQAREHVDEAASRLDEVLGRASTQNPESDGEATPPAASSVTDGRSLESTVTPFLKRARQRHEAIERRCA